MMTDCQLVELESGRVVVEVLEIADGYWSRLVGWQLRRRPVAGHGLLLVPCASIHTCLLRFPLDLVFLDTAGRVLQLRIHVRPWRAVLAPRGTHAVLELPSIGTEIRPGQTLRALSTSNRALPKSLRFLG